MLKYLNTTSLKIGFISRTYTLQSKLNTRAFDVLESHMNSVERRSNVFFLSLAYLEQTKKSNEMLYCKLPETELNSYSFLVRAKCYITMMPMKKMS